MSSSVSLSKPIDANPGFIQYIDIMNEPYSIDAQTVFQLVRNYSYIFSLFRLTGDVEPSSPQRYQV